MGRNKTLREAANGYAFDLEEGDLNTNRDTFIAGAEWAIDKACEWLEENAGYFVEHWDGDTWVNSKLYEDFRKAMEE